MLFRRHILAPWLLSSVMMFALSFVWHGLFLKDLEELRTSLAIFLLVAAVVYLVVGLGLTFAMHRAIDRGLVSLKGPFPVKAMIMGAGAGVIVFIAFYLSGVSFTKQDALHVLADLSWQVFEQAMGGLGVSLGIIHDLHQSFLEQEKAN